METKDVIEIYKILFSWPTVALIALFIFYKPVSLLLSKVSFLISRISKGKIGSLVFELSEIRQVIVDTKESLNIEKNIEKDIKEQVDKKISNTIALN